MVGHHEMDGEESSTMTGLATTLQKELDKIIDRKDVNILFLAITNYPNRISPPMLRR